MRSPALQAWSPVSRPDLETLILGPVGVILKIWFWRPAKSHHKTRMLKINFWLFGARVAQSPFWMFWLNEFPILESAGLRQKNIIYLLSELGSGVAGLGLTTFRRNLWSLAFSQLILLVHLIGLLRNRAQSTKPNLRIAEPNQISVCLVILLFLWMCWASLFYSAFVGFIHKSWGGGHETVEPNRDSDL